MIDIKGSICGYMTVTIYNQQRSIHRCPRRVMKHEDCDSDDVLNVHIGRQERGSQDVRSCGTLDQCKEWSSNPSGCLK